MVNPEKGYDKVIIIGNGFDLSLRLPTDYKDFMASQRFKNLTPNNKLANFLQERLHQIGERNWIDVERELKLYAQFPEPQKDPKKFKADYLDLSYALFQYFKNLEYSRIDRQSPAIHLLKNVIKEEVAIIDFNYTNSTQIILQELGYTPQKIKESHHKIHGSIQLGNIIFGTDELNISDDHLFIRKIHDRMYKPYDLNTLMKNAFREVVFFGHSLGDIDHTYFSEFFSDAALNKIQRKRITLYYHEDDARDRLLKEVKALTNHRPQTKFIKDHDIDTLHISEIPLS
jgi:hypothetical protein